MKPLSLRTNWSAEAWISSCVAGGLKLCSVFMFRHMMAAFAIGGSSGAGAGPRGHGKIYNAIEAMDCRVKPHTP